MNKSTKEKLKILKRFSKKDKQSEVVFFGNTIEDDMKQMLGRLPRLPTVLEKMRLEALENYMRHFG
jgi:hypothetical protein